MKKLSRVVIITDFLSLYNKSALRLLFDESIINFQSESEYSIPIPSINPIILLQYTSSPLVVN